MTKSSAKELAEKYLKQQQLATERQRKYREKRKEQGYKTLTVSVKENTKNLINILIELCEKNSNAEINQNKLNNFFENLLNQVEPKNNKCEQVNNRKITKPRTRKKVE